jgi:mono/diheme cytochrome c family protein
MFVPERYRDSMLKKNVLIAVLAIIGLLAGAFSYKYLQKPEQGFIDPSNQQFVAQGKILYQNHCTACHGVNLEGQAEWRMRLSNGRLPAPPHDETGHTWHHPDEVLFDIVKNGLVPGRTAPEAYESDMPAYGKRLSDSEITAVLAYIKSRWPKEVLKAQREVTYQAREK